MSNNWFNILVNLVGTLCLVVHVFLIGMTQLNPTETLTTLETNTLDQMDLPVLFKICISPPANLTLLKSVGRRLEEATQDHLVYLVAFCSNQE